MSKPQGVEVTADCDMYVSSTEGHSASLKAGEKRKVHKSLVAKVMEKNAEAAVAAAEAEGGATPAENVDDGDDGMVGDGTDPDPATGGLTLEAVVEAMQTILASGNAKALTTSGEPRMAALKKALGETPSDELREQAWAQVKSR